MFKESLGKGSRRGLGISVHIIETLPFSDWLRTTPPIRKSQIWVCSDVLSLTPTLAQPPPRPPSFRVSPEHQITTPGSLDKSLGETAPTQGPRWPQCPGCRPLVAGGESAFPSGWEGSFCALGAAGKASSRVLTLLGLLAVL